MNTTHWLVIIFLNTLYINRIVSRTRQYRLLKQSYRIIHYTNICKFSSRIDTRSSDSRVYYTTSAPKATAKLTPQWNLYVVFDKIFRKFRYSIYWSHRIIHLCILVQYTMKKFHSKITQYFFHERLTCALLE